MGDSVLMGTLRIIATFAGTIVLLILAFLTIESFPALVDLGSRFFTDASWHPHEQSSLGKFNLVPILIGTLLVTMGAVMLATPLGIASALFCQFYAPKSLAVVYRRIMELLAGIPSVVYGFWGLMVLVPLIRHWQPPGASLLAGILILAVMILPTIALMSQAAFAKVPSSYYQGAAALGLSRWATIRHVVFPSASSGVLTGVLLAVGRAVGETMAVLMVCGNVVQVPENLFQPLRTLTANIAMEMGPALGVHRSALFVSGLLLMSLIVVLVAIAEWLSRGRIYD
jgi:phosphate transport system permease protein